MAQLHHDRLQAAEPFTRRLQVAYKRDGLDETGQEYDHWTALDILVTETQLNVFYFDSAGDPRNLDVIIHAATNLPDTQLTLCEDVEVDGKSLAIQKDGESCSIFTIDHIFHMSKLEYLHEHVNRYREQDTNYASGVYNLDPRHLPPVLARNSQSVGFLKSWSEKNPALLQKPVDKKGHNILDYACSHFVFYPPINKHINTGIQHKQTRYAARLQKMEEEHTQDIAAKSTFF